MKSTEGKRLKTLSFVYRCLIGCLFALGLVIFAGTIYGVFFRTAPSMPPERQESSRESTQGVPFTGIGRLRVSTAEEVPGMAIIFVSFIYYPGDRAFSEELALRIADFRDIISDYIGSFSSAALQMAEEDILKAELLRRFNAILRLGQIETLYFNDFMIVG